MKTLLVLSLLIIGSVFPSEKSAKPAAESLIGAWETEYMDESGNEWRVVAILTDVYFSSTSFAVEDGSFGITNGGVYSVNDNIMTLTYEYNTADKSKVGTSEDFEFILNGDQMSFRAVEGTWNRVDNGKPGDLAGAWLITGRKQGNEIRTMTPGARKTMKILSGSWFQWIAYNSETGEFMGTGGGQYTTKDGRYTEIIEFFSRDNDRVGASLQFDYELKDGQWHHSGLSSRGEPIYEIWSRRNVAM